MIDRMAMVLHDVSVRRGDKWVLRNISWTVLPGERWALIGHNGAGKTQLLKLLSADVWPNAGDGRRYQLGAATLHLSDAKERVAYIGAEQQDKYARYDWNLVVSDLIATGIHRTDLLLHPITPAQRKRVSAILRSCGLGALAGRRFLSLSYGQKRLALLARALAQNPDWLLLDEFYNGLDAAFRRRIDKVLEASRRRGQAWIASAHRAVDVPRGTQSLLELDRGKVSAIRRLQPSDLHGLVKRAGEGTANTGGTASKKGMATQQGTAEKKLRRPSARRGEPWLLRLSGADLYVDYRCVLKQVNWQLHRGEHWALYGANGAGKSSFLKLLYGDLSPALGGRIERSGFPLGTPIADWKRQVGFVSPELQSIYAVDVSILELVASGRYASVGLVDPPTAQDLRVARRWLRFFGLLTVAQRKPRELSYGQLRRALIARAMAADPAILLLDEPLTGLDPLQRSVMKRLMERLMKQRVTLVIAVHHAEDLPRGMTGGLRLHKRQALLVDAYSAN